MTGKIIQFSAIASKPRKPMTGISPAMPSTVSAQPIPSPELTFVRRERPPLPEPLTETCKNQRLRNARKDAWHRARWTTDYWRARLDWQSALACAQRWEIADSASFPSDDNRHPLVDKWREAVVKQLLTPAPDGAAVARKRAQLAGRGFSHLLTKAERIERVIADDVAFLEAHPARRSNSEAMARSREFKEAMRQRIREIAASRNLSDEEIKPVLKLRHDEVGRFTEKHGVNLGWLLEGKGRIFKGGVQS